MALAQSLALKTVDISMAPKVPSASLLGSKEEENTIRNLLLIIDLYFLMSYTSRLMQYIVGFLSFSM